MLIILLGLALSDPQLLTRSDQVNLFFCLDVSESIPREQKKAAEAFIQRTTTGMKIEDQAGVIVFGKHPSIEKSLQKKIDSLVMRSDVNPNFTNIHDALQLAIGKLPQNGNNKIVVFSDGNENLQQSLDMAFVITGSEELKRHWTTLSNAYWQLEEEGEVTAEYKVLNDAHTAITKILDEMRLRD